MEGAQAWFHIPAVPLFYKRYHFSWYFLLCQPPRKLPRAGALYISIQAIEVLYKVLFHSISETRLYQSLDESM